MKHITILVPNEAVLASIDDPRYLFTAANEFLEGVGKSPLFNVELVGLTKEVKLHRGSFTVHADRLISEVKKTDLIFVPALFGDINTGLEANKDFIPWILKQYRQGAEVASLCIGAFLLASTGLLNGKKCSTHWRSANMFRTMFPEVNLVDDRIITEEQGLYSSGGANSYWNLLLYLLEKYTDREIAIIASKVFAVEIDRKNQSAFIMNKKQKTHEDEPVKMAQEFMRRMCMADFSSELR